MRTAACAIVKNEAPFLREWIAYQRAIGFTTVIIYDNASTDETVQVAATMGNVIDVRIHDWPDSSDPLSQMRCYADCLARYADEFDWIALIDVDEFLVSGEERGIYSLLHRNRHAAGIAVNWLCFGSNGHDAQPSDLTITAFTRRGHASFEPNLHTKMIVRPRSFRAVVNAHFVEVEGMSVWPNGAPVRWHEPGFTQAIEVGSWQLNHYFVRSRQQWARKVAKGYRGYGAPTQRRVEDFEAYDRNEVEDASAARHADAVLDIMAAATGAGGLTYPSALLPA